jgi:hypothetical protein
VFLWSWCVNGFVHNENVTYTVTCNLEDFLVVDL